MTEEHREPEYTPIETDNIPDEMPDPIEENSTIEADYIDKPVFMPDGIDYVGQTKAPEWVLAQLGAIDWFTQEIQSDNQGFDTGWSGLNKALNKLQAGWHVIAADSNAGKTSWMSLLEWNIYKNNPDAYVLSFSLDDPLKDKFARVIAAANKVIINAVRNPNAYKDSHPTMYTRVFHGIEMLKQAAWRYRAVDATAYGTDVEEIVEVIKEMCIKLKSMDNPLRLVVFIDNFHDMTTQNTAMLGNDKNKYDYIAQYISDTANELAIPIVSTAEMRKLNNYKRPTKEEIRETVKIKYEAKSILVCYNEVGLKGEAAACFWEKKGVAEKQPVYEVKVDKNKYNSFKGRLFYEMHPEMAYFEEASGNRAAIYAQAVYNTDH